MTRINDRLLVQYVDGAGVVIRDQDTGEEIVVPVADIGRVAAALTYFEVALK